MSPSFSGNARCQQFRLEDQPLIGIGAAESEFAHAILLAFFDRNHDVGGLAVPVSNEWAARRIHIHRLQFLHVHHDFEIAVVLIQAPDADFQVLIELRPVERLAHHRNVSDTERNPVRPVVPHRADDFPARKRLVPYHGDASDFHLRAFINIEDQFDGVGGGDALVRGLYRGELAAVRGQQAFEHDFSALDFRRIELAFHGEPDFLLLERVQNVGFRDRLVALVFDPADDRPLRDVEHHDFPVRLVGIVFHFEPDVFEELRVPERLKIAANCVRSVGITRRAKRCARAAYRAGRGGSR